MITEVSEEEIRSLTQSILIRYGLDFTCYEPKSLRRRIIRILNLLELGSIHELWVRFLRDQNFVHQFMNELSVGMTSMFRDPAVWETLRDEVLPTLDRRGEVNIWHAGCSTGEEVYSLGILLNETKVSSNVRALATDINLQAIEEARAGVYHKIKMIENETNYRQYNPNTPFSTYYTPKEKYAVMDPALIAHTTFRYHNLITDSFPDQFDVVMCRNVMIYFDSAAKKRLLDQFYNALRPGGYFVIGMFDTMSFLMDTDKFEVIDDSTKIFRKRPR